MSSECKWAGIGDRCRGPVEPRPVRGFPDRRDTLCLYHLAEDELEDVLHDVYAENIGGHGGCGHSLQMFTYRAAEWVAGRFSGPATSEGRIPLDLDEAVARIGATRLERAATLNGRDAHLTLRRHRGQWRVVVWAEGGRGGYPETLHLSASGWARDPQQAVDYPSASAALDAAVAAGAVVG